MKQTFEYHDQSIAAAAKALDTVILAAKNDGLSVDFKVVHPDSTTQSKFSFITLSKAVG